MEYKQVLAPENLSLFRPATLEVDHHDCFDGVRAKYGYMFNAFHRVDLHSGLRELAERHHSVPIRLGCEVYHVDCEAGIISLTDGTHVQKDLIVVANGDKVSFAVHPLVLRPLPH